MSKAGLQVTCNRVHDGHRGFWMEAARYGYLYIFVTPDEVAGMTRSVEVIPQHNRYKNVQKALEELAIDGEVHPLPVEEAIGFIAGFGIDHYCFGKDQYPENHAWNRETLIPGLKRMLPKIQFVNTKLFNPRYLDSSYIIKTEV